MELLKSWTTETMSDRWFRWPNVQVDVLSGVWLALPARIKSCASMLKILREMWCESTFSTYSWGYLHREHYTCAVRQKTTALPRKEPLYMTKTTMTTNFLEPATTKTQSQHSQDKICHLILLTTAIHRALIVPRDRKPIKITNFWLMTLNEYFQI